MYEIVCGERENLVLNLPTLAIENDGHLLAVQTKVESLLENMTGLCHKDGLFNAGRVAVVYVRWWEEFMNYLDCAGRNTAVMGQFAWKHNHRFECVAVCRYSHHHGNMIKISARPHASHID